MCGILLDSRDGIAKKAKPTWAWQCYWCWNLIVNGEAFHEQKIAEDGRVFTVRGHRECCNAHDRDRKERPYHDDCEPIIEERLRGMTYDESWAIRRRHSPNTWAY